MICSRQGLPVLEGTSERDAVLRGGYVVADSEGDPQVTLVASGSEVQHCVAAAATLASEGIAARVVSLPCWEVFERQDEAYQASVFPEGLPAVSIEAGSTFGWARYADTTLGIDTFGASAPGGLVMEKMGITADAVVVAAREILQ